MFTAFRRENSPPAPARSAAGRIACVACALLAVLAMRAPGAEIVRSGIRVTFSKGHERYAEEVHEIVRALAEELRTSLGLSLPAGITVSLVGQAEFDGELGPERAELFTAFARPGERSATIHMGKATSGGAFNFRRVLRHEIVHLAIGELERQGGTSVPRWLDEGLAMLYGDMPFEMDRGELATASYAGGLIPFGRLTDDFPQEGKTEVNLAYLESESAARFLRDMKGELALRRLLRSLGSGDSFGTALAAVYGLSTDEFDARWRASLSSGSRVLDWIRAYPGRASLFAYMALFVLVAWVVQRIRRARRSEELDRERPWRMGPE